MEGLGWDWVSGDIVMHQDEKKFVSRESERVLEGGEATRSRINDWMDEVEENSVKAQW